MDNHIISIGTANPGKPIDQERISEFMKMVHDLNPSQLRKLHVVYKRSGISSRYSAIKDFEKEDPKTFGFFPNNRELEPFPSTKERGKIFREVAPVLAIEAIQNCLKKTDILHSEISHLILVSCTGMYAPGVEMDVIHALDLSATIERYSIHFMGCYAAFNAIKMADRICDSDPGSKVLIVSVELCTIHFQKAFNEDNLLANAIFADGAAAALVCRDKKGIAIKDYQSNIYKAGKADMAWNIGDFGFEMKLTKYIPQLLEKGLGIFKETLDKRFKLKNIRHFAIHPGGKQVLQKAEQAFDICSRQNSPSHAVLRQYGNMSSATILFVLADYLYQNYDPGNILAMGFGPGLSLETLLLDKL